MTSKACNRLPTVESFLYSFSLPSLNHLYPTNFSTALHEDYKEYFTIPYFIFIRDTLSYLALLALHFAICIEPSQLSFSGLEWAILVFIFGRLLVEIKQIADLARTADRKTKKRALWNYLRWKALLTPLKFCCKLQLLMLLLSELRLSCFCSCYFTN